MIDLSVRYGIVTRYTSFLITEEDILTTAGREKAADDYMAVPTPAPSGAPAVEMAKAAAQLRSTDSAAPSLRAGGEPRKEQQPTVRYVRAKTFVLSKSAWIDTSFDPDATQVEQVIIGSESYSDLLATRPAWGDYLAFGDHVIFVAEDRASVIAYEIVATEDDGIRSSPTQTPQHSCPTDTPSSSSDPTPSATASHDVPTTASNGFCAAALAMSALTLAALTIGESWHRVG